MSNRKGTVKATYFANLLKEEVDAIETLHNDGIRVYFQQVTDQKAVEWETIREKVVKAF